MPHKVLITGASGFVGANLVRKLIYQNYEVHALVRENSNLWRLDDCLEQVHLHRVDLSDKQNLNSIVQEISPNSICHFAMFGGSPGQTDEDEIFQTNYVGTVNLLNALKDVDYECFINTGSSSEYGSKPHPMQETDVCEPIGVYGVSKAAATMYCSLQATQQDKNIGTLRLFSPYGDYESSTRLFPSLMTNLLQEKPVNLANPAAVRDFTHIDDIMEAYLKVISKPSKLKGEIFNVCSNEQSDISSVAKLAQAATASSSELIFGSVPPRSQDTPFWQGNNEKFCGAYDWSPEINLETGVHRVVAWFKKNLNKYE